MSEGCSIDCIKSESSDRRGMIEFSLILDGNLAKVTNEDVEEQGGEMEDPERERSKVRQ